MTPALTDRRDRTRTLLVCAIALFGLYVPSSIGGTILESLSMLSLAVIGVAVLALLAGSGALGSRPAVVSALALVGVLAFATVLSPFAALARGVLMMYVILAAICCARLPRTTDSPWPRRVLLVISVISLTAGGLTALNVRWIDSAQETWFAAFRPSLVSSMVEMANKPVLTFATHSMAAFMFYLLLFLALRTWQASRRAEWLVITAGYAALLVALNSTTAWLLLIVALVQVLGAMTRGAHRNKLFALIVTSALVALGVWAWHGGSSLEAWRARLVGDSDHGFIARYAPGGLFADDIAYLRSSAFRPIGVTYTRNLYLTDSGIIVALLRGSLPFLIAIYAALYFFFRGNLASRRTAVWLCVVTAAFDLGFTPLEYFRCLAFFPFVVMYLASTEASPGQPLPAIDQRRFVAAIGRAWWMVVAGVLAGGAAGAAWRSAQPPAYRAVTRFDTARSLAPQETRRAHAVTVAYQARHDTELFASVRRELPPEIAAGISDTRFRYIAVSIEAIYAGDMLEISATLPSAEWSARTANRIADTVAARSATITSAPGRVPILERLDRAAPPARPQDFRVRAALYGGLGGGCFGLLLIVWRLGPRAARTASPVL
jgi:hypothetical protein